MKKVKKIRKEENAEDYCFKCKDGGLLMICDYKDCLKAYHPACVGKDEFFLEAEEHWNCGWHTCFLCQRASKFHCYCCPSGICGRCVCAAQFAHVRADKGFCNHCLKLALLVEEGKDVDSDGEKIDFKDKETIEFLFMEYWKCIREKEGLNLANLHSANSLLKKDQNFKASFDFDEVDIGYDEDLLMASDYDDMEDIGGQRPVRKRKRFSDQRSKGQKHLKNKKVRKEFIGWGSRSLIEFLASVGKDTNTKLSQYEVTSIINEYVRENKLFDPVKKKKVVFDARLLSVFGRKSVNKNKIYDLLEAHFAENLEQSDVDELVCSSDDENESFVLACKRQRIPNPNRKSQNDNVVLDSPNGCFASLVGKNLQLVYLKRSLIVQLLKQPDTFEGKVIGSFVRVKSDPNDYTQRNSHQLVQVIGAKKSSNDVEASAETFLQIANVQADIRICVLSDDDFSEEECKDLCQRVRDGLLTRPTVVELEQKAQSLHEDITKHWIVRELALLQNLIDRANEKGWRRELFDYIDRRHLLQTSSEQLRLIQEVPKVIADLPEEPGSEETLINTEQGHDDPLKSVVMNNSKTPSNKLEGCGTTTSTRNEANIVHAPEVQHHDIQCEAHQSNTEEERHQFIPEENVQQLHISVPKEQSAVTCQRDLHQSSNFAGRKQIEAIETQKFMVEDQKKTLAVQLIVLSDDDQEDSKVETEKPPIEGGEMHSYIWYCTGPHGDKKGPFSLSLLNRWNDSSPYASKYKVWRVGESEDKAVLLTEAISRTFDKHRS